MFFTKELVLTYAILSFSTIGLVVGFKVLPQTLLNSTGVKARGGNRDPNIVANANANSNMDLKNKKILVTGAGGKTGSLVFQKLLESNHEGLQPFGLVRTMTSSKKLISKLLKQNSNIFDEDGGNGSKTSKENVIVGDVTNLSDSDLQSKMEGIDAVILCTSATPKINYLSLAKLLFKKVILRKKEPGRPTFTFPNGIPEIVDYQGARNQIDFAVKNNVKQFVFVSSMGGTQPDNFLNSIGKKEDGSGGDILLWKRKAEEYLIEQCQKSSSGMTYTIIHPGGLTDKPGNTNEIILDVDDVLLQRKSRSIPRADVADLCIAAIGNPKAMNKSFDCITDSEKETPGGNDFLKVFDSLGSKTCKY